MPGSGTILIEIISDLICPWCVIGKRRFEKALKQLDFADRIKVVWQPFELNPDMPLEGRNRAEYRAIKFGLERSLEMDARILEAGAGEGFQFNYDKVAKTPNTFNGHRLIWYANQKSKQNEVVERLFTAYFSEGQDLGDIKTLVKLGVEAGLEEEPLSAFLNSDDGVEEVRQEEARGRRLGVNGVPTFVLNGAPVFSGAQDPVTMVKAFTEALHGAVAEIRP